MPLYLRRDSIRMLEASLDALHIALSRLGTTPRHEVREENSKHAAEIGLIGSAAELAMTACLVHAHGPSVQKWPSGRYKSFSEILDEFRDLVREGRPSSEFLVSEVDDPDEHRESLLEVCSDFRILASVRAGGLHAGRGPVREAAIVEGNEVADFLECLAKSSKIRPYLENIPRCPFLDEERTVIVEDLARRLNESSGSKEEELISSVFLVLPEIPEDSPDWVDALDRVSVAPKENDINYLLDIVDDAVPATLKRTTRQGAAVPVRVNQDDPDALPIATRYLRRQFNERRDQLHADIGTANGRLEEEFLDLPPVEAVREMFAVGVEGAGLLEEQNELTAHESWPFIAASLKVQGTRGPYWYLIRHTGDLGQLAAQLRRAVDAGGKRLENKAQECLHGIEVVRSDGAVSKDDDHFEGVINDLSRAEELKASLNENYERHQNTEKELPDPLKNRLEDIVDGDPVGPIIDLLKAETENRNALRYWTRVFCEAALDIDDLPSLIDVLASDDVKLAHTAARKAIRRIDFRLNGPRIES